MQYLNQEFGANLVRNVGFSLSRTSLKVTEIAPVDDFMVVTLSFGILFLLIHYDLLIRRGNLTGKIY